MPERRVEIVKNETTAEMTCIFEMIKIDKILYY